MSVASPPVRAVDLFCGAGGLSTGLALACEELERDVDLAAVNHWKPAITTHERNHPWAHHYHAGVDALKPIEVFPEGDIEIIIAAPSCTDHSKARGGKPVEPQDRMSPFAILDWVAQLRPESVLVENVPGFRRWGPVIDGTPTRNAKFFEAWTASLEGLGYSVSHRVLTAADYGDPTSRRRLFIIARRDDTPVWPRPTHSEHANGTDKAPWRTAAEIIDWSERGQSIWTRGIAGNGKRPLVASTMHRIAQGIRRYGHDDFEPFADMLEMLNRRAVRELQDDIVPLSEAAPAAREREKPFLVRGPAIEHGASERTYDDVVGLCPPVVKGQHGGSVPRDAGEAPVQTVAKRGAIQLYEPDPLVLSRDQFYRGLESNPASLPDELPLHTVTARTHDGQLVTPSLAVYYGESDVSDITDPLPTVTTKDRFGLVIPECYPWGLDIRFRMLSSQELAAAQGFPSDYEFAGGTKEAVTAQIGNAVPVNLATALCRQLLVDGDPTLQSFVDTTEETHADD